MNDTIKVGKGFNNSFSIMNVSLGPFLLMGLIILGIGVMTGFFSIIPILGILIAIAAGILVFPPLECGLVWAAFKAHEAQEKVEVGDLFKGFDYFAPAVVLSIIVSIFVLFASIPGAVLFVPGIVMVSSNEVVALGVLLIVLGGFISLIGMLVVSTIYVFAYAFLVDKHCTFWDAMEQSRKLASKNFWRACGTFLLTQLMELVGVILCGIGVIYTTPLQSCFIVSVYRTAVPAEKDTSAKTAPPKKGK